MRSAQPQCPACSAEVLRWKLPPSPVIPSVGQFEYSGCIIFEGHVVSQLFWRGTCYRLVMYAYGCWEFFRRWFLGASWLFILSSAPCIHFITTCNFTMIIVRTSGKFCGSLDYGIGLLLSLYLVSVYETVLLWFFACCLIPMFQFNFVILW